MDLSPQAVRGRGASQNPRNRFEHLDYEPEPEGIVPDDPHASSPKTEFFKDRSQSFITYNKSPDVKFDAGINPYRGCEHGCIYCYARPTHEYLGFSAGLDFETKIMVKDDAPELLRRELSSPKWKPQPLGLSGVTDPYQPIERKLQLTRRCLEVLAESRNPVIVITKNHLVTRDIDLLRELAKHDAAQVMVSVTTLDARLSRTMEPRTSIPELRLRAMRELSEAGVPVGALVAPVIPVLTDHEIPRIVEAAADAGASSAGYVVLRLPLAVAPLFERWLAQHYPDRKDKVLNRMRALRGGKLYDSTFGKRMKGEGMWAKQIRNIFDVAYRKAGLDPRRTRPLSSESFRRPDAIQLSLFP